MTENDDVYEISAGDNGGIERDDLAESCLRESLAAGLETAVRTCDSDATSAGNGLKPVVVLAGYETIFS